MDQVMKPTPSCDKATCYLGYPYNSKKGWRREVFCDEVGKEQAEEGEADDDEVEDAPAVGEVVVPQRKHLHAHFSREDDNKPGFRLYVKTKGKYFGTLSWRCPRQTSIRCSC